MHRLRLLLATTLLCLAAFSAVAQSEGAIRYLKINAAALEGNLLKEPSAQEVAVYLPPGYSDATTTRYPVLYLLHGIFGGFTDWTKHWNIKGAMDEMIRAGAKPYIVVMPNGSNLLGGGFYLDSPVSGKWETYLLRELVPMIDRDFRTIANPASRGVAGHSMGGFGALRLAMRHPDVFGSVYAMSPCCLDLTDDLGHGNMSWKKATQFKTEADLAKALEEYDFYPVALYALASSISPNPKKPPFFVDLPIRYVRGELLPDDATYELWRASLPMAQVAAHRANLLRLRGIAIDYGTSDQFAHIITTTPAFSRELARLRIPHRLDVYDGDHREKIPERLRSHILPFFATMFR
jgi:S-formylglutathione hydrolase FrmB